MLRKTLSRLFTDCRIRIAIRRRELVPFKYEGSTYYLNPENAALYHIRNSTSKLNRMAQLISEDTRVVFDVGANCGIFSAIVATRLPEAAIHSFEPSEDLVPVIRKNCEGLNVIIHQMAVGETTEEMKLYVNPESQQTNSLNLDAVRLFSSEDKIQKRSVDCIGLDEFVMQSGVDRIDVLKVDVQGFEGAVFRGSKKVLDNVNQLFVESTWMDVNSIIDAIPLARRHGFKYAAVVNPVFMGADLLFSRNPIVDRENTELIFSAEEYFIEKEPR